MSNMRRQIAGASSEREFFKSWHVGARARWPACGGEVCTAISFKE
jgi:hypothetical protein